MRRSGLWSLAVLSALLLAAGCRGGDDEDVSAEIAVTLSAVSADGGEGALTTEVTLAFDRAIAGLEAGDIALSGVEGLSAGALEGVGAVYTLPLEVTTSGALVVEVAKSGYVVTGSPQTVRVFYAPPVVTAVTVSGPASVTRGRKAAFSAVVWGANRPPQDVLWSVTGSAIAAAAVSGSGVLTVPAEEAAAALVVQAVSALDPAQVGSAVVRVVDVDAKTAAAGAAEALRGAADAAGLRAALESVPGVTVPEGFAETAAGSLEEVRERLAASLASLAGAAQEAAQEAAVAALNAYLAGLAAAWGSAFTVSYEANGGAGTPPAAQVLSAGSRYTVRSGESLSRDGCAFAGWNTARGGGGVSYAPGNTFTVTGSVTLYAQWAGAAALYTLSFSSGEGSGEAPESLAAGAGAVVYLPNQGAMTAPVGKTFAGWLSGSVRYAAGERYTVSADAAFTAQWYLPPIGTLDALSAYLAGASGGESAGEPLTVPLVMNLPDDWGSINTAVQSAGKYVILDLSASSANGEAIAGSESPAGNDMNVIGANRFITGVVLPDSLVTIDDWAFSGCTALASVVIPAGVSVIGESAFSGCAALTSVTLPAGLSEIGWYAFSGCTGLTGVTIPDGVTSIGYRVFSGCAALTSVALPAGLSEINWYAFAGCAALSSVVIPAGVSAIGGGAFSDCAALTSVVIPDSVTSVEYAAFSGCGRLAAVTIGKGLSRLGEGAFRECAALSAITVAVGNECFASADGVLFDVSRSALLQYPAAKAGTGYAVPDSVTSLGSNAFYGCSALTSITLPAGLTTIGDYAFACCAALPSLSLPAGVTGIGNWAFFECAALTGLVLPEGLVTIGERAFYNCARLSSLAIPAGVTGIGEEAFSGCAALSAITVAAGNECFASEDGVLFNGGKATLLAYPGGKTGPYTIPEEVSAIGAYAFYGCAGLSAVTLPAGVTSVGLWAFWGCDALTSVTFAAGGVAFGEAAFGEWSDSLKANYQAGGAGTYTRSEGGSEWTKAG